ADILPALAGAAGWIFAGTERVQRLRRGPQWQSRVLPCAGRRPDVRATQAAGVVGTDGGIAAAGSADVSCSGGHICGETLGGRSRLRSAKISGADSGAPYREKAGNRQHAGKAVKFAQDKIQDKRQDKRNDK